MKLLPLIPRRSRASLIAFAATALLLALAMPVWIQARTARPSALPASGAVAQAEAFSTTDMEWQDIARARRVPGTLFWPASARERKVPLIVFSHGIGSSRDGYTHLGRYWASQGIASLHLQHVGSDRTLWQGNVFHLLSRFQNAAGDAEAIARVQDLRFALDRLLESEYGGRIARDRIVAAGHSYGANTTLMVAGARVIREGRPLQLRDPRISAAIVISAPPFYGESDFAPILSGIAIPTLHITTRDDVIRIPGFGSGLDDRLKVFDAIGGFKVLAVYKRGSHNVFTDRRYFDSLDVADEIKADTQSLSLAFLDQVYSKRASLDPWIRDHVAVLARYSVPR
jgi:Alpha/beta hydrolase family